MLEDYDPGLLDKLIGVCRGGHHRLQPLHGGPGPSPAAATILSTLPFVVLWHVRYLFCSTAAPAAATGGATARRPAPARCLHRLAGRGRADPGEAMPEASRAIAASGVLALDPEHVAASAAAVEVAAENEQQVGKAVEGSGASSATGSLLAG